MFPPLADSDRFRALRPTPLPAALARSPFGVTRDALRQAARFIARLGAAPVAVVVPRCRDRLLFDPALSDEGYDRLFAGARPVDRGRAG